MLSITNIERPDVLPYNEDEKLDEFFDGKKVSFCNLVIRLDDPHLADILKEKVSEYTLAHSTIFKDLAEAKNPLFVCISSLWEPILVCDRSANLAYLRVEKYNITSVRNPSRYRESKYPNDFRPSQWPGVKKDVFDYLNITSREEGVVKHITPIDRFKILLEGHPPVKEGEELLVRNDVEELVGALTTAGYTPDEIMAALDEVVKNHEQYTYS